MLDKLKSLLQEAPPAMAFEITEAGIAGARIGARAELDFLPLKPGTLAVSPLKENVLDPDEFVRAVRSLAGTQAARAFPSWISTRSPRTPRSRPRSSASASSAACPSTWNPPP